ncbi:MAG: sterol desaturase family protein, partial [Pseudomonadota bacterium]
MTAPDTPNEAIRKVWNFTPPLPLQLAPYWDWPLRPLASITYLLKSWNPLGTRLIFLVIAVISWTWFTPDISRAKTIDFGWIFEVWLKNIILLTVVAGGLHLLLWILRVQGDEYRYDMRPMMKGAKIFHFRNQVHDNMVWSYVAIHFLTFFECLIWWAYANGWATMIT